MKKLIMLGAFALTASSSTLAVSCSENIPEFSTTKRLGFLDKTEFTSKTDKITIFIILPEDLSSKYAFESYFNNADNTQIDKTLKVSELKQNADNKRIYHGEITFNAEAEYPTKEKVVKLNIGFKDVITQRIFADKEITIKPETSKVD